MRDRNYDEVDEIIKKVKGDQIRPFFILILIIIGWTLVWGGWYAVEQQENATVRIFGAYTKTTGPGLHLKWPFISEVKKTEITKVKRLEIGFRTIRAGSEGQPGVYQDIPYEAEMLTGDNNIANVTFIVQYYSYDAYKWQYRVVNPESMLNYLSQSCMRFVIGKTKFDSILTDGKTAIQDEVKAMLQELCDQIDFGVKIATVQLQDADPPEKVVPSFKDVTSAKEDREKYIQRGNTYKNDKLPKAEGQAQQIKNEAEGYYAKVVNEAKGNTTRFKQVWQEYKNAPEITKKRMIYETLVEVFSGADITVVEEGKNSTTLKHLPLGSGAALSTSSSTLEK